jgi:hypothetical protein
MSQAHDAIIASRVSQTHHANRGRRREPTLQTGDLVYLSTANLSFPKGRAQKLIPKYIGPYRVAASHNDSSTYTLDLPQALVERRVHPTFHASLLRRHEPNDDVLFPQCSASALYDVGQPDDVEYVVDEIVAHR